MSQQPYRLLWFSACIASVLYIGSLIVVLPGNSRLNHVSGVWLTLALDLGEGVFYRPLLSEQGYGGTRFFPLHFVLHALLMKLGLSPIAAGYALTFASTLGMIGGFFALLCRLKVTPGLAGAVAALTLCSATTHLALTTIRGDLLPAALNLWGWFFCARAAQPPHKMRPGLAALFFVLAVAAKVTAAYGFLAAVWWLVVLGKKRAAGILTATTLSGIVALLATLHFASGGRATESMLICASGGTNLAYAAGGPLRMLRIAQAKDPVSWCCVLLAAACAIVSLRKTGPNLAALAFATTAAITALVFASPGTDYNHLLDLFLCALLVLATQMVQRRRLTTILAVLLPLMGTFGAMDGFLSVRELSTKVATTHRRLAELLQEYAQDGRPMLSQDPLLPILVGQRSFLMDPFMIRLTRKQLPKITDDLYNRLADHDFSAVILKVEPNVKLDSLRLPPQHFGDGFLEQLLKHYEPKIQLDLYVICLPNNETR